MNNIITCQVIYLFMDVPHLHALRRWVKAGRISASKIGRAYTFDVMDLKNLKKAPPYKKSPLKNV